VDAKWIHNAALRLRRPVRHSVKEAIRLTLAHQLHELLALPLSRAADIATDAMHEDMDVPFVVASPDSAIELRVDMTRFLTTFNARLAWMRTQATLPERGRPPQPLRGDPLILAREYGIDLSLVQANLRRSVAERLDALDKNVEFIQQARRTRRA
jgi:hypothetical protein